MAYSTGEAAILTLIRALSAYDSGNSARQDWKPLNSGKSAYYAILRPGPWSNEQIALTAFSRTWTTVIEVFRRYIDDTKPTLLQDDVTTIIEQLEKYPTLNGASGVQTAMINGGDDMQEVQYAENGPLWAKWEVNCVWIEEKNVTFAE